MGDFDGIDPDLLELGLPELFRWAVRRWPDRVAAAFPGERLTYTELERQARDVAGRLARAGVGPGDHVGLLIPNSGRFLATLLGIGRCGAVPVPLNTRFRTDELPYVVAHADLVGLVTVAGAQVNPRGEPVDYPARLAAALPSLGGDPFCAEAPRLCFVAGFGPVGHRWLTPWPEPAAGPGPEPVPSAPDGTALLLYTSGTTARPKGVLTPHRALVVTGVAGMLGRMGMTGADVVWSPAPLCHIGAYVALVGALATGGRFVSAPYFRAEEAVGLLERERVTIAYAGFPAFYLDLARQLAGRRLPALRMLTTAAAPGEIERVRAGLPGPLQVSVTGSTELSGMICVNDPTDTAQQRATTAGRPLDGIEVSIRDERGAAVGGGGTGEIWVRGYCLLAAYHRDPEPVLTGDPGPRLVPDRGPGRAGRGPAVLPRPAEGHGQGGRGERGRGRGRGLPAAAPGGRPGPGGGGPGRPAGRGAGRLRRADAGAAGHRGRADRVLPGGDGRLQGAAGGPVRDRVADLGHQDLQARAAGPAHRLTRTGTASTQVHSSASISAAVTGTGSPYPGPARTSWMRQPAASHGCT